MSQTYLSSSRQLALASTSLSAPWLLQHNIRDKNKKKKKNYANIWRRCSIKLNTKSRHILAESSVPSARLYSLTKQLCTRTSGGWTELPHRYSPPGPPAMLHSIPAGNTGNITGQPQSNDQAVPGIVYFSNNID